MSSKTAASYTKHDCTTSDFLKKQVIVIVPARCQVLCLARVYYQDNTLLQHKHAIVYQSVCNSLTGSEHANSNTDLRAYLRLPLYFSGLYGLGVQVATASESCVERLGFKPSCLHGSVFLSLCVCGTQMFAYPLETLY